MLPRRPGGRPRGARARQHPPARAALRGGDPAAAGGANIAGLGLAAAAASITHVQARRVDWRLVAWMLPPSVLGAIGGGAAAAYVPADVLRIVIGSVLLAFGVDLLRPRRPHLRPPPRHARRRT